MTTQSIIVYRNPYAAAFFESGLIVPLGAGLLAFFLVVVLLGSGLDRIDRRSRGPWVTWLIIALAAVAGVATYQYLVI